ncbi:MAG TPA: glycosyltransferase 87 family protein, partial [Mycobacterium sp.]|nr:glycosyltransferase 87 family protein [Mycobacterium sp.]
MRGAGLNLPALLFIGSVCAALTAVVAAFWTIGPYDLEVYRAGGSALWHGISLYGHEFPHPLPFTYPPFAGWLFVPLAALPWGMTVVLWTFLTLALLAWVIAVAFAPVLPAPASPAAGWARAVAVSGLLVAFALTSPLVDHLGFGQINVLLMALCLADLLGARPSWLPAGVLIGLAAAIKLVPALFIVYLLMTRRPRAGLIAAGTAALATGAAAVLSFADSRRYFTDLLWHLDIRVGLNNNATIGNQSLQGALLRAIPVDEVRPVWLIGVLVVLAAGLWAARRAWLVHGDLAGATATGLLAVLVSPVSWPHHLVWLVPAIGVLIGWWWRDRSRWAALLGGLTVGLLLMVRSHRLGQLLVDSYPSGVLRITGEVLRDSFMLACAAVVVALGCAP